MRLFLDTEFNGFDGDLISIALVPETGVPFYKVVHGSWESMPTTWIEQNVIPKLGGEATDRTEVGYDLAKYLRQFSNISIIADWPRDFVHFLELFNLGNGQMITTPDFACFYRPHLQFRTDNHSKNPHNALFDAMALRDYVCIENNID